MRTQISFRSAQLETIQALVRAGLGISLIPAMALRPDPRGLVEYRSLKAPRPERKIIAAWPKQRPPNRAALAFLEVISAQFKKTGSAKPALT